MNLGAPINSTVDDFCPTPIRGGGLFFASRREPASCGANDSDLYFTRLNPTHGWSEPLHLACAVGGGPNSTLDEMGPSYVEVDGRELLYFSSGPDIYMSERGQGWNFGPAQAVTELNSTASDIQPNVRKGALDSGTHRGRAGDVSSPSCDARAGKRLARIWLNHALLRHSFACLARVPLKATEHAMTLPEESRGPSPSARDRAQVVHFARPQNAAL